MSMRESSIGPGHDQYKRRRQKREEKRLFCVNEVVFSTLSDSLPSQFLQKLLQWYTCQYRKSAQKGLPKLPRTPKTSMSLPAHVQKDDKIPSKTSLPSHPHHPVNPPNSLTTPLTQPTFSKKAALTIPKQTSKDSLTSQTPFLQPFLQMQ